MRSTVALEAKEKGRQGNNLTGTNNHHKGMMTAVISGSISAQTLFLLLGCFKKVSGLAINYSKTEGMWIGSNRGNKTKPFGIKWPNEPIKALGIFYKYDQKLLQEKKRPRKFG